MHRLVVVVSCLTALARPLSAAAAPPEVPLVEKVDAAIQRAVGFLRAEEKGRGHWENAATTGGTGGITALATLALLNAGVKADDPLIQRSLEFLRKLKPEGTYTVGLCNMVFAEVGDPRDLPIIQGNVDWLLETRQMGSDGTKLLGWSYGERISTQPDFSNAQYALLGLHAGRVAGARINLTVWEQIERFYADSQTADGAWSYRASVAGPRLTMTAAGFSSLHIAGQELNARRRKLRDDGVDAACGVYPENEPIARALSWLGGTDGDGHPRLRFDNKQTYYNIYGIERAGRLSGMRFLANRDWYREGCRFLVETKPPGENGSWRNFLNGHGEAGNPVVCTAFALLFLSKGRTPVLLSKFAHGPGDDWNTKHSDARHLTEYATRELFKKQPLAWQVFDVRKLDLSNRNTYLAAVGELLASPVVMMSGHEFPRLTDVQKQLLRRYLDDGGLLFAEACCGRLEFATGFRRLMAEMFPDSPLMRLPPTHPVWTAHAPVPPTFADLEGIDLGGKTVVVFSQKPLSGFWESNQLNEGRGRNAFRLAGNVIAYATGLEMPPPRLTEVKVVDAGTEPLSPTGHLRLAQLRHEGKRPTAPRALPNLIGHLRAKVKLDVDPKAEEVRLGDPSLFKYRFLYMHGRNRFEFAPNEVAALRANLKFGGTLLADACCGKPEFDAAFRAFAAKLFPDERLEAIPPADALYSAAVNGRALASVRVRLESPGGTGVEKEFRDQPPQLEGIKVNGRWAVIYSKYDIGCGLENRASSDCRGHDKASAFRLCTAAVLYSLTR